MRAGWHIQLGSLAAFALAITLAGCNTSQRFGRLRRGDTPDGPPQPATALQINTPPGGAQPPAAEPIQQAAHVAEPAPLGDRPLSTLYERASQRHATMD